MTQPPPPAWVRIADTLAGRIASGQYRDRIPSRAALAAEFGVAPGTAARAVRDLAARGVIRAIPGRSYSVRDPGQRDDPADPRAWVRVAEGLRERIACGELKPWDQVLAARARARSPGQDTST